MVEVGTDVNTVSVGDMVTGESMNWCGACMPCRMGMVNQCQNLEELGFTVNGAFAEYVAAEEKFCYVINALKQRYGDEDRSVRGRCTHRADRRGRRRCALHVRV